MSVEVGLDVSGKIINLGQLRDEMGAASVAIPNGLAIQAPDQPPPDPLQAPPPPDPKQPAGARLFTFDAQGEPANMPTGAQAVVDAHVAMRPKTSEEYAAEFQDPSTTAARRQEIRDIQAGLLPPEYVPVESS